MVDASTEHRTPGQLIAELLEQRGWNQQTLAIVLQADAGVVNRIIGGKKSVSPEMALALADVFELPAERFLELQMRYELAQARLVARPDPGRARRASLFGGLPIAQMIKRRWLDAEDVRNVTKVEAALVRFFGATTVDDIEILPHAAKKTDVLEEASAVQIAWLHRARAVARTASADAFSQSAAALVLEQLRPLRAAPEEARKVPRILSEAGIRYVLVESLPGAKIDGACFWLDDLAPVIAMTCRHDRIDNFWFVLRHELEHVLLGHGKSKAMLDHELEGERAGVGVGVTEEERAANAAAAEFCVPQSSLQRFIERKAPFFSERDVLGFARTVGAHPGLVAGQLQHKTGRYDRFRSHQVKVRGTIALAAMVDGWGDVAPVEGI